MAGRGRGRRGGRGGFSFDVSAIGFGRGEQLPAAIQQPPPLFPPLEAKPLPLCSSEKYDYMLSLKQEFRGCMRNSPYFLKPKSVKKDIERYSDRYREKDSNEKVIDWQPDWRLFPSELKIKVRKRRTNAATPRPRILTPMKQLEPAEPLKQLDTLVSKEVEETETEEKDAEGSEQDIEEEYDEEEQEEDNDYLVSHFDDDEDYGFADDDDMDEGPIY